MGCPPVRGNNQRALASGLPYVGLHVKNHGMTIRSYGVLQNKIFRAKVGKGGINKTYRTEFCSLGHAPGVGLGGAWGIFFFEHGHLAYQIEWGGEKNRIHVKCSP